MIVALVGIGIFILAALLAVVFLAWRDRVEYRLKENARPLAERIITIRQSAVQMRGELLQLQNEWQGDAQRVDWIPTIVNYLDRVEVLAQDADATPLQADQIATEARQYVIDHRLSGVSSVAVMAATLSRLLQTRAKR